MKQTIVVASLALLVFSGCHKKQPATTATDTNQNAETAGTAATTSDQPQAQATPTKPLPPSPTVAANAENSVQAGVNGQADAFLTSQLRIFINQKGRLPQSFTEFARLRLDSMPTPPAGTKWVIDSADSQVKAVPK